MLIMEFIDVQIWHNDLLTYLKLLNWSFNYR